MLSLPAIAGASAARQQLGLVRVGGGFSDPVYVTAPASEPGRLYVVTVPGGFALSKRAARGRHRSSTSVDASARIHPRRTALDGLPPELRAEPSLLRRLHGPATDTRARRVSLACPSRPGEDRARAPVRAPTVPEPQRRATPNSVPTTSSTWGWVTADPPGDPQGTVRILALSSASSCGRIRSPCAGRSPGMPSEPLAFQVLPQDGCPRPLHRRCWPGRTRGGRLPAAWRTGSELRLGAIRGGSPVQGGRARPAVAARVPDFRLQPRRKLLRDGRLMSIAAPRFRERSGDIFLGDYCSGIVWSLRVVGREGNLGRVLRAVHGEFALVVRPRDARAARCTSSRSTARSSV